MRFSPIAYAASVLLILLLSACATAPGKPGGSGEAVSELGSGAESAGEESPNAEEPGTPEPVGATDAAGSLEEAAEEPSPPIPTREIPMRQLMSMVRQNVPEKFLFVSDEKYRPLTVYQDLDQNGLEDIFFLLVEEKSGERKKELSVQNGRIPSHELGSMARLFSEESRPHPFYLALFLRSPGGLVSMYRIPLGSWFVFEDFSGFRLNTSQPLPYCIDVTFQTHEGQERQWISFSRFNNFSFFKLQNNISITSEIRDIDEDGFLDVVEWRKVFEEGTGYETFLTWYRWDGQKFSQKDSSNIVRNLNRFLQKIGAELSEGEWGKILATVLPSDLQDRDVQNLSGPEMVLRLFPPWPTASESSEREAENGAGPRPEKPLIELLSSGDRAFHMVVFPRILENPFGTGEQDCCAEYRTRFSVRFILRDGTSLLRECVVQMSGNPFSGQQFFLKIPEEK